MKWIHEGYSKDRHIPTKDLVKIFENYSNNRNIINSYMFGEWNSWTAHASIYELLILCLELNNMPSNITIAFCGNSFGIYGGKMKDHIISKIPSAYSYELKMKKLNDYRYNWTPASGGPLPPGEESFAINYFDKVEKILNMLKEEKMLN
jgi:hypothetical protein